MNRADRRKDAKSKVDQAMFSRHRYGHAIHSLLTMDLPVDTKFPISFSLEAPDGRKWEFKAQPAEPA